MRSDGTRDIARFVSKLDTTPYRGLKCEITCPGYNGREMSSVCSGHGSCTTDGACACDAGWVGDQCSFECIGEGSPCSGHGVCNFAAVNIPEEHDRRLYYEVYQFWKEGTASARRTLARSSD